LSREAHKLTIYFGERDRDRGRFLADRLLDVFGARGLAVSMLMRGVEGFGVKHAVRTDRLLTLSEDLPLVAVAVDEPPKIESALSEIRELHFDGLITIERARLAEAREAAIADGLGDEVKLTLYLGRGRQAGGRPAYERAVRALRERGVAGATVMVGVDGTVAGRRRRARFFARNLDVPAMVISVGERDRIAAALPELGLLPGEVMATIERARVLKRDGLHLTALAAAPDAGAAGLEPSIKLMLYSSERNRFGGHPAHVAAIRALHSAGAPGATTLRGVWGYHGDHEPHGDTVWSVRRRVPTVTVVIDRPAAAERWLEVLDHVTPERGMVTAEIVPALSVSVPHTALTLC
jgi:PII-like signaling protein